MAVAVTKVLAATLAYGMQLRREATSTEIENLAYYMDSTGSALEGGILIVRSAEFYQKSPEPW